MHRSYKATKISACQVIVKERLGDSLSVQNTNDGAVFKIALKSSFAQNGAEDEAIS